MIPADSLGLSISKMSSGSRGSANACLIGPGLLGNRGDFLWKRARIVPPSDNPSTISAAIHCLRVIGVVFVRRVNTVSEEEINSSAWQRKPEIGWEEIKAVCDFLCPAHQKPTASPDGSP